MAMSSDACQPTRPRRTGSSAFTPNRLSHAKYAEFEASVGIVDAEILSGDLPRKQVRLVQTSIELHRDEALADWELAASGENP